MSTGKTTYEAMKPIVASIDSVNRNGHRALGALGGPLVDVLDARLVGRQARVGERVVRDRHRAVVRVALLTRQVFLCRGIRLGYS